MTGPQRPLGPSYGPRPTDWPQAPGAPGTDAPTPARRKIDWTYPLIFLVVAVGEIVLFLILKN